MHPSSIDDPIEKLIIVKGNVQGVGFRATVLFHAKRLGLLGTTRNLPDGNVEIRAQGSPVSIKALLEALHKEFDPNHISEIIEKGIASPGSYSEFSIIH